MSIFFSLPLPRESEHPIYLLRQEIDESLKRTRIRRESIEILIYDEHASDSLPIFELLLLDLINVALRSLQHEKIKSLAELSSKSAALDPLSLRILLSTAERFASSQSDFIANFQKAVTEEGLLDKLFKEIELFYAQQKAGKLALTLDQILLKRQRIFRSIALVVAISLVLLFAANFMIKRVKLHHERLSYLQTAKAIRIRDLRSVVEALQRYYIDNKRYPITGAEWKGFKSCWGASTPDWVPGLAPKYISNLPRDPRVNLACDQQYIYRSDDGIDFRLLSHKPEDCVKVRQLFPEMFDMEGCHRYGYWSVDSKVVNLEHD